jgi:hypothetical protein
MSKSSDLVINIIGNSKDINKDLKNLEKQSKNLEQKLSSVAKTSSIAFAGLTTVIAGTISAFRADEQALFRTEAVIKSTGKAAGLSAEEISKMSRELQDLTTFSDSAIQSGANLLLTFTNVGKETFPRATKAILDMSTAMGTGLKESAIQVGKALNDPILGVSALTRVGVQFTEQQKSQIKVLTEANQVAEAQVIILAELEKQFGGAAEAAAKGTGVFKQIANSIGNLSSAIGELVFKRIEPYIQKFNELVKSFRDSDSPFKAIISNVLVFGTAITGVIAGISALGLALIAAKAGLVALGLSGAIVVGALTAIAGGVTLVVKNLDTIKNVITGVQASWELFTNFLKTTINDVLIAINKQKIAYRELGIAIAEATPGSLLDDFAERQKKLVDDLINENVRLRKDNRETAKSFEEIYDAIDAEKAKEKIQKQNQVIQEERQKANAQEIEDQKAQNERKLQLEEEQRQILAERKQLDREIEAAEKELALEQELEGNELEKERLRQHLEELQEIRTQGLSRQELKQFDSDNRLREADRKDKKFKIDQEKVFNEKTINAAQTLATTLFKDNKKAQIALLLFNKRAALKDIEISTAKGVARALGSAEPPRSWILAAITAAKGAIQLAAVASQVIGARDGALVGDGSPNMARGDRVPFMLERGELVVPRRNFDEVVSATARSRGFTETTASGDRDIMVQIDLTDNAAQILTADQFENTTLGTDRA